MTAAPPPAERGRTVIAERAVRRIAARAAAEGLPPYAAGGVRARRPCTAAARGSP